MAKKKNTLLRLGVFSAFIGGAYAFSDYHYKISSLPKQRTDADSDYDQEVTDGRMFVRNHHDRQDMYLDAMDQSGQLDSIKTIMEIINEAAENKE